MSLVLLLPYLRPALNIAATEATLPSGLRMLMVEDHSAPVISFQVWVHVGSKNERPGITGISHLFEHMMFKGSRKFGPEEHARLVQSAGGILNAYTQRDVTVYFENLPADKLETAFMLEAERFQNLNITEATLKTEREVVKEERRLRTDNTPMGRAFEEFASSAFHAHPYSWPVVGWMSDLNAISVADCKDYFRAGYAPNNALVVLAGDFDPAAATRLLKKHFGRWKRQPPRPPVVTMEPDQRGERRSVLRQAVQNPLILGGYHIPGYAHPDLNVLDILSKILSAGQSSRLYQKLVIEEQSALHASGGVWRLEHPGVFFAVAGVKPGEDPARVEASFFKEVDRFKTEAVGEQELQQAKNQLEADFIMGLKRASSLASAVGEAAMLGGSWQMVNARLAAWQAVTPEDLMRVARQYFTPENRTLVTLVPDSLPNIVTGASSSSSTPPLGSSSRPAAGASRNGRNP